MKFRELQEKLRGGTITATTYGREIEKILDSGHGTCPLSVPQVAQLVESSLLHFEGVRYDLPAWVIMPTHVHVLVIPRMPFELTDILHTWKSFSAHQANADGLIAGRLWQSDYFDRAIRSNEHWERVVNYIELDPVRCARVRSPEDWRFSSAYWRVTKGRE